MILISSANLKVFAEAEYDSLPILDGKNTWGSASTSKEKPEKPANNRKPPEFNVANKPLQPKLDMSPHRGPRPGEDNRLSHHSSGTKPEIASSNDKIENKNTLGTSNSPQLDLLTPKIKAQHRESSLSFNKYKKDLKEMLDLLIELKAAIDDGLPIQEYSAMTNNVMFMNELFVRKYNNRPECHYETYQHVQNAVNSAVYARDYWIKTNKITYNLNGMPEKVIQTKFLKVATSVDKLVEIIEMETALKKE